jgi:hypothetical protein
MNGLSRIPWSFQFRESYQAYCALEVAALERITGEHGFPKRIKVDNGPEFIYKDMDRWAYWNHVELDFSRTDVDNLESGPLLWDSTHDGSLRYFGSDLAHKRSRPG